MDGRPSWDSWTARCEADRRSGRRGWDGLATIIRLGPSVHPQCFRPGQFHENQVPFFQIHLTSINYLGICNTDETIKNLHQLLHIVTLWFDIHVPPVLGRCSPVSQLLIHLFTKAMDQRAQGWRGREGEYLSDGMPTFSHGAMDSHGQD